MPPRVSPQTQTRIAHLLLNWYRRNKRDLPWRQTNNPYHILLSECMLQQTQVDTVIPYYHRFLKQFPTLKHLADAPQPRVLKAWEGLGYYARARNLHRAAQEMVATFNGAVPDIYDTLFALPGFGPYTTAAVLSIAFNRDHAVLDGNVIRVLCRLFEIREDITRSQVKKDLWNLAERLLAKGDAGNYNQAIMELGATVCTPRSPNCPACPLSELCAAFKTGTPEALPFKAPQKKRPHHILGVGIVWRDHELLIARRPETGLLGGLWEFPAIRQHPGETLQACCLRGIREETGITVAVQDRFRTVKHAFTHFSVTMHAFQCTYQSGTAHPLTCSDVRWVPPGELTDLAFSRANRKLIDFLLKDQQSDLFE